MKGSFLRQPGPVHPDTGLKGGFTRELESMGEQSPLERLFKNLVILLAEEDSILLNQSILQIKMAASIPP